MDKKQEKIRKYVYDISKGMINLKVEHIKNIILIANDTDNDHKAMLYRQDYVKNDFEHIKSVRISQSKVEEVLKINEAKQGTNGFYRWDIYNDKDDLLKQIFSVNSHLF